MEDDANVLQLEWVYLEGITIDANAHETVTFSEVFNPCPPMGPVLPYQALAIQNSIIRPCVQCPLT